MRVRGMQAGMKHRPLIKRRPKQPRAQRQLLDLIDRRKLELSKLIALERANTLGHVLGAWHRRPNDPLGRTNAFCQACNMIAVAGIEPLDPLAETVYGHAVTRWCTR